VTATRSRQTLPASVRGDSDGLDSAAGAASVDERDLVRRLRSGDEAAFAVLVERHHPAMVRLALGYVRSRAVAEEVAQDAWLGLLRGLDGFEGRASLRTWLFKIVVNRAITAGRREHRYLPVDDRELEDDDGGFSQDGWWMTPPVHWADQALDRIAAQDIADRIRDLISRLPPGQRQVVTLRDVEGLPSDEVCLILGITEANQRVLLHRARSRIRSLLEREVMT
jgi:RNA polymerase sigma-70 factor (ECF subfamily)